MPNPRSYRIEKTRAILVGIKSYNPSVYNGNIELKTRVESAIERSVKRFEKACRDILDVKQDNITVIDTGNSDQILRKVIEDFRDADQAIIFYFCGHAVTNEGDLFLGLNDLDINSPNIGSLEMNDLHTELRKSPAEAKIIILDCCFAGAGFEGASLSTATELVRANVNDRNTFGLAASAAGTMALVPDDSDYTALTGTLCEVLEKGIDSERLYLTLDDVYQGVKTACLEKKYPRPVRVSSIDDEIAIAKNRMFMADEGSAAGAIPRFFKKMRVAEARLENLRVNLERLEQGVDDSKIISAENSTAILDLRRNVENQSAHRGPAPEGRKPGCRGHCYQEFNRFNS